MMDSGHYRTLISDLNKPVETVDMFDCAEPSNLRSGDEFELMGQKYRVHRVAKKNIVIRKIKTVNLGEGKEQPGLIVIDEVTPFPGLDALYGDSDAS